MANFEKKLLNKAIIVCAMVVAVMTITMIANDLGVVGVSLTGKRKLPIYSVDTKEKKIALTFDVNWGNDNTEKILDILDKYNAKATFFVIGKWADDYPEKVKDISKRGHDIGNHTNMHPDMTLISDVKMIDEIQTTDVKLRALTGKETILFRCPSGSYNDRVIDTVEKTNHYCIQWDVDSIDWKSRGAEQEYDRVMKKSCTWLYSAISYQCTVHA